MNKSSRNYFAIFVVIAASILLTSKAHALIISVVPSSQSLTLSDLVSVDIVASDLGNGGPDSISAYDIELVFDPTILQFNSFALGNNLDLGILGSFGSEQNLGTSIKVDEVSFESSVDLDSLQAASFTLFTLNFSAIGTGTSMLMSNILSISDASGFNLLNPNTINNSRVLVSQGGVTPTISESTTKTLTLLGFGLFLALRKKHTARLQRSH